MAAIAQAVTPRVLDPTIPEGQVRVQYDCPLCDQPVAVLVDAGRFVRWYTNPSAPHVQEMFPELSAPEREVLISGTHAECFDRAFPPEDPEEAALDEDAAY